MLWRTHGYGSASPFRSCRHRNRTVHQQLGERLHNELRLKFKKRGRRHSACIIWHLCWLHRTSSVPGSLWTSQFNVQDKTRWWWWWGGYIASFTYKHNSWKENDMHCDCFQEGHVAIKKTCEQSKQRRMRRVVPLWFGWLCEGFPLLQATTLQGENKTKAWGTTATCVRSTRGYS